MTKPNNIVAPNLTAFAAIGSVVVLVLLPLRAPAAPQDDAGATAPRIAADSRSGLLAPIPDRGGVPPIVDMRDMRDMRDIPTDEELAHRARARGYDRQLRLIRRAHFGTKRVPEIRAEGIARLDEFVDSASFRPMVEVLEDEHDDVRHAMLDHFRAQGDEGQAALAHIAIMHEDEALRTAATERMVSPPGKAVLAVLDQALRSPKHEVANSAGLLAGTLGAVETIPLLIFGQWTRDPRPSDEGDLAWIAIQTQVAYVQNLVPVVGDNSGAYQPVVGILNEGIVLRVHDAVVIVYRTEIHYALVEMAERDWGRSLAHLGYDMKRWWHWYNDEYVPYKNDQRPLRGG